MGTPSWVAVGGPGNPGRRSQISLALPNQDWLRSMAKLESRERRTARRAAKIQRIRADIADAIAPFRQLITHVQERLTMGKSTTTPLPSHDETLRRQCAMDMIEVQP